MKVAKRIEWLIGVSIFAVAVLVTPNASIDPINAPKLWMLSTLGFGAGALLLSNFRETFQKKNLGVIFSSRAVFALMVISMLVSGATFAQQFFGVNGQNTGLLAYFAFGTLFIAAAISTTKNVIKPFLIGAGSAFTLNAIYGLAQAFKKDPINWVNPYSSVIGTFGNPDFVSAFLGMSIAFALSYAIYVKNLKLRISLVAYMVIALFDIKKSNVQQGMIISLITFGLILYFYLRSKNVNPIVLKSYLGLSFVGGIFGILGSLNKGPLAAFLYKTSVTYRGDYWHASIKMVKEHPLTGVGLDSYGDWYRSSRSLAATLRRGPGVVSNAAHNVFLDIASTAGVITLLAYLVVIFIGFRAAYRNLKRSNNFDPFFVGVFVCWIGYLIQSAISINNLALGIWGWVLPGLLISIERWNKDDRKMSEKVEKNSSRAIDFSGMVLVVGLVIGAVIGYFPFNADANFRHALESGDANKIYMAATKWPQDSARMIYAAQIFNHNDLPDQALTLTKDIVKIYPRNFDAWIYIFNAKSTTAKEKAKIYKILKELDPFNPDLKLK